MTQAQKNFLRLMVRMGKITAAQYETRTGESYEASA